jgi:hypothetical protein
MQSETGTDTDVELELDEVEAEWREAGFTLYRSIPQKDGDTVERVEFLEPCVAMLKVMDQHKGDVSKGIALVARMTTLSPTDVHKMHPKDFARCQLIAVNFFGEFLPEAGPSD